MANFGIVNWNDHYVIRSVSKKTDDELYFAAKIIEKHIKRSLKKQIRLKDRSLEPRRSTGELHDSIKTRKSKYTGWYVGVIGEPTAEWVDSLGARAIFFEFGTAAPGDARGEKQQPPRPFFKPGLRNARREIQRKLGLKGRIL